MRDLQLPLPRLAVGFLIPSGSDEERATLEQRQAAIEAGIRDTIAHPTVWRRRRQLSREAALAQLDSYGAGVYSELDAEPPGLRMTWAVRIYYRSEAGEILAAEFGGLSWQRAKALKQEHTAQAWNDAPGKMREDGEPDNDGPPPVLDGARLVIWPSEHDRREAATGTAAPWLRVITDEELAAADLRAGVGVAP